MQRDINAGRRVHRYVDVVLLFFLEAVADRGQRVRAGLQKSELIVAAGGNTSLEFSFLAEA